MNEQKFKLIFAFKLNWIRIMTYIRTLKQNNAKNLNLKTWKTCKKNWAKSKSNKS